jgi:hypothetical protein
VIAAWNGNIMPRSLPWLQELRSGHCAQLMFLSLQSSSYASFPLAAGASMVFLVAAERVSDGAAALFDSPVRFSRREELE